MVRDTFLKAGILAYDALRRVRQDERGQGIMEYSILLGAIALIAAVALFATGGLSFADMRDSIQGCINFDAAQCNP
jgi:hypothetical protein